ncbi:hypothetical protein D7M11_25345 [Paenibacillus ginsengarvi]|uniref:Uncharacterized protein n=1 Tax=Paenibacillus ginsengarvi TaxID=400777 RepID=A0A3B0BU68_9BACL|nr:hypothetical protein D7M11_25345 [Paenibacillus ginsengarvi]
MQTVKVLSSAHAESPEAYTNAAEQIPYLELARYPNNHRLKRVTFTGKVVQLIERGNITSLRVNVTKDRSVWNDTIYVNYVRTRDEERILENDLITLWGVSKGLYTYDSTMRTVVTIPEVDARFITNHGKET